MKVSVVIPCYNVEDYIEACLQSVYSQTYSDYEVICIDNNSTDNTYEKLSFCKKKFPGLIVDVERKPGAPAARNKGIELAQGEWFQFLDADDVLLENKIENQIKIVLLNPETTVVVGNYIKRRKDKTEKEIHATKEVWKGLFATELGITSSNLYKASEVLKANKWDESYNSSQESKLLFELLKNDARISFSEAMDTVIQERDSGQISSSNPKKKWTQYIELRMEIAHFLKNEKTEIYQRNQAFFESKMFMYCQILSKYDSQKAMEIYKSYFDGNYYPSTLSFIGKVIYQVAGFKNGNVIYNWLKK